MRIVDSRVSNRRSFLPRITTAGSPHESKNECVWLGGTVERRPARGLLEHGDHAGSRTGYAAPRQPHRLRQPVVQPPCRSARPSSGRADESMFTDTDPVLHRNKQATLHIMRELLQCGQWDRSAEWLTDRYIQHNPNANSGREGVVFFFTQVMRVPRIAQCDKLTTEIVAVTRRGRPRHRDLAAQLRGPAPSRPVLLDDVVRHLALRRRQSRRALGSGDRGSAAVADAVPASPVSLPA